RASATQSGASTRPGARAASSRIVPSSSAPSSALTVVISAVAGPADPARTNSASTPADIFRPWWSSGPLTVTDSAPQGNGGSYHLDITDRAPRKASRGNRGTAPLGLLS